MQRLIQNWEFCKVEFEEKNGKQSPEFYSFFLFFFLKKIVPWVWRLFQYFRSSFHLNLMVYKSYIVTRRGTEREREGEREREREETRKERKLSVVCLELEYVRECRIPWGIPSTYIVWSAVNAYNKFALEQREILGAWRLWKPFLFAFYFFLALGLL